MECTLSHPSYFAVEQREEVGEAKGLHPSLSGAAPAQRERERECVCVCVSEAKGERNAEL